METNLLKSDTNGIQTASAILKAGGLTAIPTETVYGLAADALNGEAVRHIFEAKGRPTDNPLIVHIAAFEDIERLDLAREIPDAARKLSDRFWPGPLTIVLKKGGAIPDEVSAGLDTVAIRMPSHPVARELIRTSGLALAAPSANSSGRPSPTTAAHVMNDLNGKVDAVLDGGACEVGVESTVLTLVSDTPRILRPGLITKEALEEVLEEVEVDPAVLSQLENGEKAASPGMKYKHYAPRAQVILVRADDQKYINYVNRCYNKNSGVLALCYDEDLDSLKAPALSLGRKTDVNEHARRLFERLREIDAIEGVTTVYARCPRAEGVGMALYNRLIRAAAFRVIDLPRARIIGLTGQTGAGKSEVCSVFAAHGWGIIDADLFAHAAVEDSEVKAALVKRFGAVLDPNGMLDRRRLAHIVFTNDQNLEVLNAITHPKILSMVLEQAERLYDEGYHTIVFDAPTLFESGADVYCDTIIGVLAPQKVRLERIMARDEITRKQALMRMRAQKDEGFFIASCDEILNNDSDLDTLKARACAVAERLKNG